jgi:hypothetical protein
LKDDIDLTSPCSGELPGGPEKGRSPNTRSIEDAEPEDHREAPHVPDHHPQDRQEDGSDDEEQDDPARPLI